MVQQLFEWKIPLAIQKRKEDVPKEMPAFLKRLSTLLDEGYTLTDSINMLLPYHVEDAVEWRKKIDDHLRKGSKVFELFQLFKVPQNYLIMIKIADSLGNLSYTLRNVSNQMDFEERMKKKLKKLLMYPIFLLVFLMGIFISFRIFFLPNLESIFNSRNDQMNSNVTFTKFLFYTPDLLFILVLLIVCILFIFHNYFRKKTVEEKVNILIKLPVVNYFFKLQMTKTFAKSLGDLLIGGFSLQHALNILKEQEINPFMSYFAEKIEQLVIFGETLSKAVLLTELFFSKFEEFIEHGEHSGYLGKELIIYFELLDEKFQSIIKTMLSIIQPLFFIIIAICIVAAYLSILLPMYNLIEIV